MKFNQIYGFWLTSNIIYKVEFPQNMLKIFKIFISQHFFVYYVPQLDPALASSCDKLFALLFEIDTDYLAQRRIFFPII